MPSVSMMRKCYMLCGSETMFVHSAGFDGWPLWETSPSQTLHSRALISASFFAFG